MCFVHVLHRLGVGRAEKNFRVGIFLNKNLLGYGYRKQTTFFFRPKDCHFSLVLLSPYAAGG